MLRKLVPKQSVRTIYDIQIDQLWSFGVRGIITDLDNTLVGARDPHATPELIEWLAQVRKLGFKVVIVSNNRRGRVSAFAEPLGIPFIYGAKKPTNVAFHKAMRLLGTNARQTAVIGDQMLTDVLGGNRMGLYTILVQPISVRDEGFFTKVNRRIEKLALSMMKKS
ncbi:YqeG family HAD IIIA-type phosphatase [Paenibacillus athensensis]|uniref:YqeG family HAD IIIA-type phosphatase n=1 Tax=Paenibacillus athensensis TaxID=1967502 RepID=A0A4Y8Q4M8_9BACL|nr:YqeG family HAD IIIA-type phosphatase [Paenibacillus athensensis]MCD1258439.1 YqeG family HAD IIIA-type phosphatase [Paenibacillus athensensis]